MLNHIYNKPNKIKISIYLYEGKGLIHASNRFLFSGFTQNQNENENSKYTKENIVPNIQKRLFANSDYYRKKIDNSTSFSIIQNKFSEFCSKIKHNSNTNNEKYILSVMPDRLLTNYRNNVVNFKFLPFIRTKFQKTYQIYEEVAGMDKIRLAQEKVSLEQEKLKESQDRRRDIRQKLTAIRKKLQQIDTDKLRYARDDDRYLDLIKKETDLKRDEQELLERFDFTNIEERERFAHLSSATTMSHEQERTYNNMFKYWNKILAVIVGLIGVIATILNYRSNNQQIEKLNEKFSEVHETIMKQNDNLKQLTSESWGSYISRKAGSVYHFVRRD